MAFIIDKISNITSSTKGNDTIGQWAYCTTDSKATVLAADYFVEGFTLVRDTDTTFKASEVPLRYIDKFNLSDVIEVQLVNSSGVQIEYFAVAIDTINYDGASPSMTVVEFDMSNDVNGPASSTDNAIARFDSTTGTLIQNSGVIISDANAVSGVASLNINSTTTVDGVIDDDSMATASATKLATSESVKAYVDASAGGGGSVVLLASATASASATIDFDNVFDSTYDNYFFILSNIKPATNLVALYGRVGTGATPTYDTGSNYLRLSTLYTEFWIGPFRMSNTFGLTNGRYNVYNPSSTTEKTVVGGVIYNVEDNAASAGNPTATQDFELGAYNVNTAVTSFRFFCSSGNITSGSVYLYGIVKS